MAVLGFGGFVSSAQDLGDGTLRRVRVPILMYHYVGDLPPNPDEFRVNLTVSTALFRAHLQYMADEGYTTISLADLENALREGTELPERPVVLTFDDGHIDHYTNVFPALQEFRQTGTFFLISGRLDAQDPAYISWEQAREMAEAGMSMEAHTKNHPDLRDRDTDFLTYEILGGIESIKAHKGVTPVFFAFPGGRYDDTVLTLMDTTTIQRAVTTEFGNLHTTDNTLLLPRLRVSNDTSVSGLAYLLSLGGS
jgi:peptidoglycan/xylan/chitin deacetylase (PgdA/CDA1 family)